MIFQLEKDLSTKIGSVHTVIGRYERDEVKSTIDVVKKLANVLDTTVGYFLGETEERELLKDPTMLRRLNDIAKFPDKDKDCILYTLDAMINNEKLKGLNV